MVLIVFIWFLLSFSGWCCCHCFMPIFIRDRRKKSFPKNPTELGGARRMWEVMTNTCNSLLSAANGSLSICLGVPSWRRKLVVGKHQATVCPTLRAHWLGGARRMWEVMTNTCNSLLSAANGSLSICLGVPSWRRKLVVGKHQATVCPTLRAHWRLHIHI